MMGIQYLRAFLAIGVVVFHASQAAGFPISGASFRVPLFFVISGFMMFTITDEHTRPGKFLFDRIVRIAPLYWIATLTTELVFMVRHAGARHEVEHLAASLLFIPHGAPPHYFPALNVGWTLNYEMLFYVLFAAVLFLPRRWQVGALTAIFVLLLWAGDALAPTFAPLDFWTRPVIIHFLLGVWLAVLWRRLPIPRSSGGSSTNPIARLFAFLGNASYSIYLWHPMMVLIAIGLVKWANAPSFLIFPLGLIGGIAAGIVGYKLVEVPLLQAFKRRRRTARGVPIPSGP